MQFDTDFMLTMIGIVFIMFGIVVRTGYYKDWYWKSRGGIYGYIPLGLMMIIQGNFKKVLPEVNPAWSIAFLVPLLIFAVYISMKQPAWVKPSWVSWVEEQPKEVRQAMREDALSDTAWAMKVKDRASVQAWAKEIVKGKKQK